MSLTVELSLYGLDEVYTMYFSTDTKLFFNTDTKIKAMSSTGKISKKSLTMFK